MSLTGSLDVFPLQEVLRMLARSNKTGCLRIQGGGSDGRIFLANGSMTLTTVVSDEDFRRQLTNAGLVTDEGFRTLDMAGGTLTEVLVDGVDPASLTDFVREHVVESLYRIRRPGIGAFEFNVDVAPRYQTGQSFDSEVAVSEADRRSTEWEQIEETIDDLDVAVRMARKVDDESVTVSANTWEVLAALESGASVNQLAGALGLSRFRIAQELSGLVRSGLVSIVTAPIDTAPAESAPVVEAVPTPEPAPVVRDFSRWSEPEPSAQPEVEQHVGTEEPVGEVAVPAPSWFETEESVDAADLDNDGSTDAPPMWGTPAEPNHGEEAAEAPVEEDWATVADTSDWNVGEGFGERDADEEPAGGWWGNATEQPAEDSGAVEATASADDEPADTDAFLRSVFSQLDETDTDAADSASADDEVDEESADETGFSMGLLRRRRMGAAARDITDPD